MIRKASGRSALILAAGLVLCLNGPVRAIELTDGQTANATEQMENPGKPVALNKFSKSRAKAKFATKSRRSRGVLARGYRSRPVDTRTVESKAMPVKPVEAKTLDTNIGDTDVNDKMIPVGDIDRPLPDNVANANAQWPAPNAAAPAAGSTPASPAPSPNAVASDQLNDSDKTLSETPATTSDTEPQSQTAPPATEQRAVLRPQPSQEKLMSAMAQAEQASATGDSAWGQSSTIGKFFIAIGGLLTFASAIRMFMT